MSKFKRKALLLTCILSLQLIKSVLPLHARTMTLTYDDKQHTYNKPPITLHIDERKIDMPIMPPVQIDGRTLVPTREVFEPMGASVEWKTAEKKVFINRGNTLMIMGVNDQEVWIDGKKTQLDVPPKIINDKLMLPLRFIGETLGYQVDWQHEASNININQDKVMPAPPTPDKNPKPDKKLTSVVDVQVDNKGQMLTVYTINFDQAIDSYTDFQEKGKIVVDINQAKNLLASRITLPSNPYVDVVRTSQFTDDKTRVVFDLKAGANARINLSSDRRSLTVEVEPYVIEKLQVGNNNLGAFIVFPGMAQSQLDIFPLANPDRLVIDIPMSKIGDLLDLDSMKGECVSEARISIDSDRTRIVLNLQGATPYEIKEGKNGVTLQLSKPVQKTTKNLEYKSVPRESFTFKKAPGMSISDLAIKDDYRNKKITIALAGNYEHMYDDGVMHIGSAALDKIIVKSGQKTTFTVYEKQIQAFDLVDDGENIKIIFMTPREKHNKIVVLDIGHGGSDSGARKNGLLEKTVNMEQGMPAYELLEKDPNIKVYITRVDDSYPTNPSRAALANEVGADMFVSLHNNSFTTSAARGTEVYYSTRSARGKQMAEIMQKNLTSRLGTYSRGTKQGSRLLVLNSTQMPAILVETAFLSNLEDAQKLKSPAFNKQVGQIVYESIVEMFNTLSFR